MEKNWAIDDCQSAVYHYKYYECPVCNYVLFKNVVYTDDPYGICIVVRGKVLCPECKAEVELDSSSN